MGISSSKSKRKLKQIIIVNSNVADINVEFNFNASDHFKSSENEEDICVSPTLKWHKATPKEEIVKMQREAEIRDIETIYENSRIRQKDLLNLMPDHYWSGAQNTLPRYVMYRGDYPEANVDKVSNLRRVKSSSLNDLTQSIYFNFNSEDSANESHSIKHCHKSTSCPQLNTAYASSLSKVEKDVPIKGILKKRKQNRPNSAMIMDKGEEPGTINYVKTIVEENDTDSDCTKMKIQKKISIGKCSPAIVSKIEDIFSGYFDQSHNRVEEGPVLRVNRDKKNWLLTNLDKRLSLRPTSMDLANRNILHERDESRRQIDFEQTRCLLNEKLSERPTLMELKKQRIIKFSDFVEIQETDNYDRSVCRTWGRLTEVDKESIRNELNEFKDKEMKTHFRSKRFTRFHDSHNE